MNERTYVAPQKVHEEVSNKETRNHFEPREVRVSLPRRADEASEVRSAGNTVPTSARLDVVTCRFGIMFFPNVAQALHEIRRVLKPGGRTAFVALGPLEQNPWQWSIVSVLRRYVHIPPPEAGAPHPLRFAQPGTLSLALQDAGFRHVHEEARTVPWPWPGLPEQLWAYRQETGASLIRRYIECLAPEQQESVRNEVITSISQYYDGREVNFTAVLVVASGVC